MNTKPSKITLKKQDLPRRNFSTQSQKLNEANIQPSGPEENFFSLSRDQRAGNPQRGKWAHLAHSGSQSEHRIRLIFSFRGFCHIINVST